MLRRALYAYGVLYLAVAVVLYTLVHASIWLILYLAINGALIVGGLRFERRYRPIQRSGQESWQSTGERFVDQPAVSSWRCGTNPRRGNAPISPLRHRIDHGVVTHSRQVRHLQGRRPS